MKENKEKITEKACELFFRFGIRSVTMSDIASELGMSKKTLYQSFDDKTSLVEATVQQKQNAEFLEIKKLLNENENAIDILIKLFSYFLKFLKKVNPAYFYDIQKYYPELWKVCQKKDNAIILEIVTSNLEQGIKNDVYRKNIDIEVIAHLLMADVALAMDEKFLPNRRLSIHELQRQMIEHFIRGIVTQKGLEKLENYIKTNNNK